MKLKISFFKKIKLINLELDSSRIKRPKSIKSEMKKKLQLTLQKYKGS